MPKFLNNNPHVIYVNLPSEPQPVKLREYEEREATGEDADALDVVPGVINLSTASKEVKQGVKDTLTQRELLAGSSYQEPGVIVDPEAAPADDLDELSVSELRKRVKDAGLEVEGTGKKSKSTGKRSVVKADLVKALEKNQGATPASTDDSNGGGPVTSDQVPAKGS